MDCECISAIPERAHCSAQKYVDLGIKANDGYPLVGSVRTLDDLMPHTLQDRHEALGWVWADRWSHVRLWADLSTALGRTVKRSEATSRTGFLHSNLTTTVSRSV